MSSSTKMYGPGISWTSQSRPSTETTTIPVSQAASGIRAARSPRALPTELDSKSRRAISDASGLPGATPMDAAASLTSRSTAASTAPPPATRSNAAAWSSATRSRSCVVRASSRAAPPIAIRTSGRSARSPRAAARSAASASPTVTFSATSPGSSENHPTSETTSGLPRTSARIAVPDVSPIVGERRLVWTSQAAIRLHNRPSST